ncbi:MAG: inorganic pyrophosphatase Ppa [Deltaproteobacteria bacterium]|nr:inorganic pyrophosphatase Ppa [Deltaproteobacteria bacterium]
MTLSFFLEKVERFDLVPYENKQRLKKTHVPFSGTPKKHPTDDARMVLLPDPLSSVVTYYEFAASDVEYVERLPNVVALSGENCVMVRLWVKKGCVALRSTCFVVAETPGFDFTG